MVYYLVDSYICPFQSIFRSCGQKRSSSEQIFDTFQSHSYQVDQEHEITGISNLDACRWNHYRNHC